MKSIQIALVALLVLVPCVALAGEWQDLGGGWKFRVDLPGYGGEGIGKVHVHVNNGKVEMGIANVDGTPSHGKTLDQVPESVKKKIREHDEFKKGQKKQQKLDEAMDKIEHKQIETVLNADHSNARDILTAAAIVIAATATTFFPADDAIAWANFFRVVRTGR